MPPLIRSFVNCFKCIPSKIKKLKLRNCGVNKAVQEALLLALKECPKEISALNFSANKELDLHLLKRIIENTRCDSLDLSECEVNQDTALKDIKVKQLKLNYQNLSGPLTDALVDLLTACLTDLSLVDCEGVENFLLHCIESLLQTLPNHKITLKVLNIAHNEIRADGMKALGGIIKRTYGMSKLIISNCDIEEDGLKYFAEEVKKIQIFEIDLSNNCDIKESAAYEIGEIVTNCHVEILDLSACGLTTKHIENLRQSKPRKIRKLFLNESPEVEAKEVGRLVAEWNIQSLYMRECRWSAKNLMRFRRSLGKYKLKKLDISEPMEEPDSDKISGITSIFPSIAEKLIYQCRVISPGKKTTLQNEKPSNLKLVLGTLPEEADHERSMNG